ncbi:MAG: DUF4097 family beta strand repeat protein [Gemmatimonadales bacterium]|nr:DUF4097 family beta strand repeat protein [Gemmatimonadales bacterium]
MLLSLATAALSALALAQQIDSTVPVERGLRLDVNAYGGEIAVQTWGRNAVRVESGPTDRARVEISRSGTTLDVRVESRRGPPEMVDLQITVPDWMALDLSGVYTDISVVGTRGPVSAETVQGEIKVEGGSGLVSLQSVQGGVSLTGAKGRIEVHSVNQDVEVIGSSGEITAETVNGSVTLSRVDASSVSATTVNGDVEYDGPVRNGGRYSLSSHNGDLTLVVAQGTNASVAVSTFNGEFESDFPVTLTDTRKGRRFSFTLGTGSAQVTLESFQGTIQLVRPGPRVEKDEE